MKIIGQKTVRKSQESKTKLQIAQEMTKTTPWDLETNCMQRLSAEQNKRTNDKILLKAIMGLYFYTIHLSENNPFFNSMTTSVVC